MKVILLKNVQTLGEAGEVKEVSLGYARNYLFPCGLALPATPERVKQCEVLKSHKEKQVQHTTEAMRAMAKKLEGKLFTVEAAATPEGKLYAAVHKKDIAHVLAQQGIVLPEKTEVAPDSIKMLGIYDINIVLSSAITAKIKITVQRKITES